jgi:DNA repair exonuclease SbcCD ATPase subunit
MEKVSLKKSEIQNSASEKKNELLILKQNQLKELSSKKNLFEDLRLKIEKLKSSIEKIDQDYENKKSNLNKIKKEVLEIENNISNDVPICVTCKQKIGEEQIVIFKNLLEKKNQESEEISKSLNNLSDDLSNQGTLFKKLKDDYSIQLDEISKQEKVINETYDNELNQLSEKVKDASEKIKLFLNESIIKIEDKYDKIQKENLNDLSKYDKNLVSLNEKLSLKSSIENEISNLKSDLKVKQSNFNIEKNREYDSTLIEERTSKYHDLKVKKHDQEIKLSEIKRELEAVEFWKSAFSSSGIPSMLIDEAIPEMNRRVKYYLEEMGGRYIVSFDTLSETKSGEIRDKIYVNVLDTITKSNKRKAFSGGQVRIVDIAVLLTLSDIQNVVQNMKTNLILLDEVFDSLDEENISYVSGILRKICKDKSINIITHTVIDQIEADQIFRLG